MVVPTFRLSLLLLLVILGCARPGEARIETIDKAKSLPYSMKSLTGVRDGDLLRSQLVFAGNSGSVVMNMIFRLGVPTRLESGHYALEDKDQKVEGSIREISVTFLGGQGDRPSLGGVFELLTREGTPLYKVTLPTTMVSKPVPQRM